jgi:hypothetical protein
MLREGALKKLPWSWTNNVRTYLHNSFVKTRQKRQEGRRMYCPCEIRSLTSYTWKQNVQSNLGVSQERKIVNNNGDPLHMLPMLVVKRIMSTIKQPGKKDNVRQRPFGITQLLQNNSSRNVIKNIFDIDLHHNQIKV